MKAILLAAGVARRLTSLNRLLPKCLLTFDGKSLLTRHLENLERCQVSEVLVVVGHLSSLIDEEIRKFSGNLSIRLVFNPDFERGSVLSLKTGLRALDGSDSAIIMDADVLYHPTLLERLVRAPFDNGFLLDPKSASLGEEMMLGVNQSRVWTISRGAGKGYEIFGEGVGFFKVGSSSLSLLEEEVDRLVSQGKLDADYENAIDAFLKRRSASYVPVEDLPWTEIDFDEDVENARAVVLPAIQRHEAAGPQPTSNG